MKIILTQFIFHQIHWNRNCREVRGHSVEQ